MAPLRRKTRKVNGKLATVNEEPHNKEEPDAVDKSKIKKRKLVDLVGAQWSKEELESFYDSYRKYGKNWRKVSGKVCNKTPDMVEDLYNMNQAYLSLPEGAATVAGLIAMMTDHYSNLEGDNAENECDELPKKTSSKPPPKRLKSKQKTESKASESEHTDLLSLNPVSSSFGTQSVLNTRPRAVGKRTPRICVPSIHKSDNRNLCSPTTTERLDDDGGAHMAAMTLVDCSQRGDSLHFSYLPTYNDANIKKNQNWESEKIISKAVAFHDKEEGHNNSGRKGLKDNGNATYPSAFISSPSRSQQLFSGDEESHPLFALHTLADLSLNVLQPTISKSESSAEVKDNYDETDFNENQSKHKALGKKDNRKVDGGNPDGGTCKNTKPIKGSNTLEVNISTTNSEKGNKHKKPTPVKVPIAEENMTYRKVKHTKRAGPLAKSALKFAHPVELLPTMTSPTREPIDVSKPLATANSVELQTKIRNRRKSGIVKAFSKRENWHSETTVNKRPFSHPFNSDFDLKENPSHALSNSLFRRWCRFEWFYSAIDYPWFAQNEFVEWLNFLGLGRMPKLTREEWGFIRGSLGKPCRFSAQFLKKERVKLNKYRELVREHDSYLRTGKLEGLQTDLAHSLIVGQRVIAFHPKSKELRDGSVLTVDSNRCRVQFDRSELGIESVLDIDCMPLNLVKNVSDALRRIIFTANKFGDPEIMVSDNDRRAGPTPIVSPSYSLECVNGFSCTATSHPTSNKQTKLDNISRVSQQEMYREKEADIQALADLFCAVEKMEALLKMFGNMNEELLRMEKENDSLSDLGFSKNQYAIVYARLQEAHVQVESARFVLSKRNTYNRVTTKQLSGFTETYGESSYLFSSRGFNDNHNAGPHVTKLMENSRKTAKMMVDAAFQAMWSTKEGEEPDVKVGEVLDSLTNYISESGSSTLVKRCIPLDSGHVSFDSENPTAAQLDPSSKMFAGPEGEINKLISSCISTYLMIQGSAGKGYPPAEVMHMLDSALLSMKPRCRENEGLYRDIESSINTIKTQMISLVITPTSTHILPRPVSFSS